MWRSPATMPREVSTIAATYCQPAFATWAATQLPASRPVCVYQGVEFDRNDYCAE